MKFNSYSCDIKSWLEAFFVNFSNCQIISASIEKGKAVCVIECERSQINEIQKLETQCQSDLKKAFREIESVVISFITYKKSVKPKSIKEIPGIKNIIAIASGKGGVGKSTVVVNVAIALKELNFSVGIVDIDIYGPSFARMLNVNERPEALSDSAMLPIEKFGILSMSMSYLVPEGRATIWRGPIVTKALTQLIQGTQWGELDYLIVDLPPGTGDIHLSFMQNFEVSGVVVISTPQNVALIDAKKAVSMCNKMQVPVMGLVENMSYYMDASGNRIDMFGSGGIEKLSIETGIRILGSIPLDPKICSLSDSGTPAALDGELSHHYLDIARSIVKNNN